MAKRTFASALPVITIILFSVDSPASFAEDGCTMLQELVKAKVYESATGSGRDEAAGRGEGTTKTGAVGSTLGGSQSCPRSARAASAGFNDALAALGMSVTWTGSPMNPGDYCLSHDLGQCYPALHPFSPALPPNHTAFVADAWTGVREAVASQMPFGTAAGIAHFTPEALEAALASGLPVYMEGPLYLSPQGWLTR